MDQKRHFDRAPVTSDLPPRTDIGSSVCLKGTNLRHGTRTSGLVEGHADPLLFAPDDVTRNVRAIRLKDKIEKIGDVAGVSNLERRPPKWICRRLSS
jgi:hypothetical protein